MKKLKILTVIFITMMISVVFLSSANTLAISTIVNENNNVVQDNETVQGEMQNYARSSEGEPVVTSGDQTNSITDDDHNHVDIGDIHQDDLYVVTGSDYVMDQLVDGNVYIFAKNVKVTGQVNGSVFICSSGSVEIAEEAYIACQLFIFADDITINGMILDVYSASQKLEFGNNALIYRGVKSFADKAYLAGTVGRDFYLIADEAEVSGEELMVYGNFNYESKSEITDTDRLNIGGDINFKKAKENTDSVVDIVVDYVFSAIATVIFDILLYLGLIFIAPKFIAKSKDYVSTKGLLAFAIGLAFLVIVPVIAFGLMLTGFLAGISIFMLFAYGAVLMINAFIVAIIVNEFIASKIKLEDKLKKGLLLIPVSIVLWAVRKIPVIGFWISIITCLCGIGVVLLYQFDKRKEA